MLASFRRFGLLTDEVSEDLDEALAWIVGQGLGHVELRSLWGTNVVNVTASQAEHLIAVLERYRLPVSGIASPIFKCALDASHPPAITGDRFGSDEVPVAAHYPWLERTLRLADRLGASHVRIFSFWREAQPEEHQKAIVAHLNRACDMAQAFGMRLVLENEPTCNGGSAPEVAALVALVNRPELGMLWDPGNDAYGGFPVAADQAKLWGPRVFHVHLKDVKTHLDTTRSIVPLGQGGVPWAEILSTLDQAPYEGRFSLEPHVRGLDQVEACVRGLSALLQER